MSTTDTDVQNLIVNKLTLAKYKELKEAGTLSDTESYEIIDIDGLILDFYGTCSTAAGTQAKVVTCVGFTLLTGVNIRVKFTNAQDYNGAPTLNVNGTGAISVKSNGTTNASRYYWKAGEIVSFTYDGTNWLIVDGGIADTTYYGMTKLVTSSTSTSTTTSLTPASLNNVIQNMIEPYPAYSTSSTYVQGDRIRYSNNAWECNTTISTAEAWTEAHWTKLDPIQTQLDDKQETLTSGTNIKTINGSSILGSGDLVIQGTGGNAIWGNITGTIRNQTDLAKSTVGPMNTYIARNDNDNSAPYKKIAECQLEGIYQTISIPFIYAKTNAVEDNDTAYMGKISCRVEETAGTLNTNRSSINLNIIPDYVQDGHIQFFLLYKNNTPESTCVTCEIWIYVQSTWSGITVMPLRVGRGGDNYSIDKVTWGSPLTTAAALPTGYSTINQTLVSGYTVTPSNNDNSQKIATTAYVKNQGYLSNISYDSSTQTLSWS